MSTDLRSAIVEQLRGGQTRSAVELVVDLAVPYQQVIGEVEALQAEGTLSSGADAGQTVYKLAASLPEDLLVR